MPATCLMASCVTLANTKLLISVQKCVAARARPYSHRHAMGVSARPTRGSGVTAPVARPSTAYLNRIGPCDTTHHEPTKKKERKSFRARL